MLGKAAVRSGDSGYSETDERQSSRCSDQDYLISTESALGVELQTRLDSGEERAGRTCLRVSTDLITPPQMATAVVSATEDGKSAKARMTGSSCQALRHAVAALNRLDDFTSEKIGSGFFSEVFKVTHRTTGQVMVLKMNLLRSNRPNMLKEVQLMNQLSHPNILGFMGVCVHEGQLHALTEYINGGSLEQLNLNRSLHLPHRTRMRLAGDIARGMQYLHSRGVFHRDLTSKNVLIKKNEETDEMTAVVGDFGLAAKIPDPKSGYRLPTVGSPYWMSPECLKGQWYDERSDVFSYGIVLCELIARCEADPDVLPRTENFGLDYLAFAEMCGGGGPCGPHPPPPDFLKLAFLCCTFEPKSRPSFSDITVRLDTIVTEHAPAATPAQHDMHDGAAEGAAEGVAGAAPPPKMAAGGGLGARSEELLPGAAGAVEMREAAQHKKLVHRRSLSEDVGTIVFPPHTAPSDKARCHFLPSRPHPPPPSPPPPLSAKRVGESMLAQDPHYRPSVGGDKANPFAALAQFRGVKKIIGGQPAAPGGGLAPGSFVQGVCGDLFSSCFELPSPFFEGGLRRGGSVGEFDFDGAARGAARLGLCREDSDEQREADGEAVSTEVAASGPAVDPRSEKPAATTRVASKPMSLPGSPTALRRRLSPPTRPPTPPDAAPTAAFDEPRNCQSHLDLASDPDGLPTAMKRRGSCESGFFSSIGEDFGFPTPDLLLLSPSSRLPSSSPSPACTLSSSSLFLLDDSAVSTTTAGSSLRSGSGELGELDDLQGAAGAGGMCRPHHSLLFAAKRSSSIYTDSSEDISSLGGGDLYWEELRGGVGAGPPQQISKIVEYFERKQSCSDVLDADVWGEMVPRVPPHQRGMLVRGGGAYPPERGAAGASPMEYARRMEGASLNEALRSSRIEALMRSLERPRGGGAQGGGGAGAAVAAATGCVRRAVNATQRLMICEGAVKSKLPLFDKKS